MKLALRVILVTFGVASFVAGAVAVFATQNGTGAAALLTAGVVLALFAMMGDRIESLELGNAKLRLRAAAADKYLQAETSERAGDLRAADELRSQARALLEAADPLAARYASVRGSMPAGPARTRAMEQVMADARRLAADKDFDPHEVRSWLREGNDERRVMALALMQEQRDLRDYDLVMDAIAQPHSAFEQYHAMRLAAAMINDLAADQRHRLADVLRSQQQGRRFQRDRDLRNLSQQILDRLGQSPPPS
jgi:hypothetical protein